MPGPVGKRSTERHGHRTTAEQAVDSSARGSAGVEWPGADEQWHPVVRRWYSSLQTSGQATWYEPSDVAAAIYVAEAMDRNLKAEKFSAVLFGAAWSAMGDLLTTEASRRRLRIELEKGPVEDDPEQTAAVASLDAARTRLGATKAAK